MLFRSTALIEDSLSGREMFGLKLSGVLVVHHCRGAGYESVVCCEVATAHGALATGAVGDRRVSKVLAERESVAWLIRRVRELLRALDRNHPHCDPLMKDATPFSRRTSASSRSCIWLKSESASASISFLAVGSFWRGWNRFRTPATFCEGHGG